jgi:zinc protease
MSITKEKAMRSLMRVLCLAVVAVALVSGTAAGADYIKRVLPENGLTVIVEENHSSPVVNLRCYVRAGSILEGQYLGAGISHFIEHVIGDETKTRSMEQMEKEVEAIGGGYNAYTTKDHACYFIETSRENFDKALELLADQMMNSTMPQEAVDTQQGVITREINMGYDEPGRRLYNLYGETMFRVHPTKYPTIGYVENFEKLTRDNVLDYYTRMYVPNNMVFVAVGDFDGEETYAKIHEAFKGYARKPIELPTLPAEPPQLGRRELREQRDLDMAYVIMGFHTVPISHPDLYPLDLLSFILTEGNSSKLYKKLVDELGLVYSVTSSSHTPSYDAGNFSVSMAMDPANIDEAIRVVSEEIYGLKKEKVAGQELATAKKLKTAEFHFGRQDMESIASSLGTSELTTGTPDFDERYAERIQDVTADEIQDAVRKYFYDDNLSIAVLEPPKEAAPEAARAAATGEANEIARHVLANGLTVLIKENHTSPVVSIGSYSLAGARIEDAAKGGEANFVARMLPHGTKKMSGEQINRELDSMGASFGCSANHTRIESDMTVLSEDFPRGLAILADMLQNPKFDPVEMEKERPLIQAQILARGDDWNTDAMDRMLAELFKTHPYGRCPVGTSETVAALTRDDLVAYHAAYVTPGNTVLTVFGDVDPTVTLTEIEKAFKDWRPSTRVVPPVITEPERTEPVRLTSNHDRAQTVIFMGYQGMTYSSEDRYAMDVLDGIISGINYPGGWLHNELRGNSLVYVVHAYNWTGLDTGYFGLYAATYDEALEQALNIIDADMALIAAKPVTDEELEHAKQLCIIMNETLRQTNSSQARDAAISELYGVGYGYNENYGAKIAAVTKDDVLRVARKYLKNPVTILRRPNPPEERIEEQG